MSTSTLFELFGGLMIHHGQEKLADPQQFANTYVASLHLPFPLFFAYAAGFSELIGSWLVILGLLTPVGALALSGTMTVAAYQHISTAGFNIYVLELVLLYLGGSLALLFNGPGRFSFDAGIVPALLDDLSSANDSEPAFSSRDSGELRAIPVTVNSSNRGLGYPQDSAALSSRSMHGMQLQTAFAMRSVIATIEKRLLKRKQ